MIYLDKKYNDLNVPLSQINATISLLIKAIVWCEIVITMKRLLLKIKWDFLIHNRQKKYINTIKHVLQTHIASIRYVFKVYFLLNTSSIPDLLLFLHREEREMSSFDSYTRWNSFPIQFPWELIPRSSIKHRKCGLWNATLSHVEIYLSFQDIKYFVFQVSIDKKIA